MATSDLRDGKAAFKRLSKSDQSWVYWAVETGVPVPNPELADVTVAYARYRLRIGLVRDLPFYGGSAVAGGFIAYLVSDGSSGASAFTFVLGLAGFVGHLWWWSTFRPRQRGLAANLALLQGEKPAAKPRPAESSWGIAVSLALATTWAISAVVHVVFDVGNWVGLPVFVGALVLYRRLVRRTNESIDDWSKRAT
ncbi:MAG TPA: hypothetical protein VM938_13710 [Acidimicrobiales bacterium]|nr:hypothetical protein [Acidimicrobiales bacterium]